MKTTTTAVPFTMLSLKLMPQRTGPKTPKTSKYAEVIEAANKYQRKGAVIDLTDATPTVRNRHYANIVSALKSRGLTKVLKLTQRGNQLWIHKASKK
jgi:hypothetical protein